MVEVVAGKPFEDYVHEKIFVPLGMKSSYWTVPHSERGRMSTNFLPAGGCASELIPLDTREDSVWYLQPSFPYGGAGLVMSALDYDQLLAMLMNQGTLNGALVLRPDAVDTALSNLLPNNGKGVDLTQLYAMVGLNVVFGAGGYVTTKPMMAMAEPRAPMAGAGSREPVSGSTGKKAFARAGWSMCSRTSINCRCPTRSRSLAR